MGYVRHSSIVITAWDDEYIRPAHIKAKELGMAVSDIVSSPTNGYVSFFIAPDGSKEGWPESDKGDQQRADFIQWLRISDGYLDWVAMDFGGDFNNATIEDHADNFSEDTTVDRFLG